MTDIVERLSAPDYWFSGSNEGHEGENDAPFKAAAEITRLRNELHTVEVWSARIIAGTQQDVIEIARLRAEVERAGRDYNTVLDAHDYWVLESERLRDENERLKHSRDRYRAAWEKEKRRFTAARAALEER